VSKPNDDENASGRFFDILTEASKQAGAEGIAKQDVIPAVSDFLTSIALIMARSNERPVIVA